MFVALRALLPGREGILFIRLDNVASRNAHARMACARSLRSSMPM
jgi:hypothetical protein